LQTHLSASTSSAVRVNIAAGGSSRPSASAASSIPLPDPILQPWSTILGSASSTVISTVISNVLVTVIRAAGLLLWQRSRVPSALSRRVKRRSYLATVRAESSRPEIQRLDVYAPRLLPARDNKAIAGIQSEWEKINSRGRVRVIVINSDDCLQAGAECQQRLKIDPFPTGES